MRKTLSKEERHEVRRFLAYLLKEHPLPWKEIQPHGHGADRFLVDATYPKGYASCIATHLIGSIYSTAAIVAMPGILQALLDEIEELRGEEHFDGMCELHPTQVLGPDDGSCFHCRNNDSMKRPRVVDGQCPHCRCGTMRMGQAEKMVKCTDCDYSFVVGEVPGG